MYNSILYFIMYLLGYLVNWIVLYKVWIIYKSFYIKRVNMNIFEYFPLKQKENSI